VQTCPIGLAECGRTGRRRRYGEEGEWEWSEGGGRSRMMVLLDKSLAEVHPVGHGCKVISAVVAGLEASGSVDRPRSTHPG
jgi:hypothetical protein